MSFLRYEKQCKIGMTIEEMDEVLLGKGYEKNRQKIMELTYNQQWMLTEYLCERLVSKETEGEEEQVGYGERSQWIDNVLDMLQSVDENGLLAEKAFCFINKAPLLLRVVGTRKTRQYLALCEKVLGPLGA